MSVKRWILIVSILLCQMTVYAKEEPQQLYAQSAVLMDADSGRVLFEKNGYEQKAMASTTKIMTCILALENGELEDIVTFSDNAAMQPKVHLGAKSGSQFVLKDLLCSLMLESHNDSAVAIAEHIAGSVEEFAVLMNRKAKEIGCQNTHFVTPNGLDGTDDGGAHATTAADLARIMSYCIKESPKKEMFLKITQTQSHAFGDVGQRQRFGCYNKNAFLTMMEGAVSGKTGYTAKAGYCYVGALERDGRTFVVALLACGWPDHKNYKWSDTKDLMEYAVENYEYRDVFEQPLLEDIVVENGIEQSEELYGEAKVKLKLKETKDEQVLNLLLRDDETIEIEQELEKVLKAPVNYGDEIGTITYYLNDEKIRSFKVIAAETVKEKDFRWYFKKIVSWYML